jgi:alpha-1,3-glucan synthase
MFEHDTITNGNQMRHGGDVQGVVDSLDYLQGLGIRVCCLYHTHLLANLLGALYCWQPLPEPAMDR